VLILSHTDLLAKGQKRAFAASMEEQLIHEAANREDAEGILNAHDAPNVHWFICAGNRDQMGEQFFQHVLSNPTRSDRVHLVLWTSLAPSERHSRIHVIDKTQAEMSGIPELLILFRAFLKDTEPRDHT
jgi:hypothetical protein